MIPFRPFSRATVALVAGDELGTASAILPDEISAPRIFVKAQ